MVNPQIFTSIEYTVVYEGGLVLVLPNGSVKQVYHFEDYFPFEDHLVLKMALKIN